MSRHFQRSFSTEFKCGVVQRIEAGERLAAVADELGIRRKLLYEWRDAFRAHGAVGLNRKGNTVALASLSSFSPFAADGVTHFRIPELQRDGAQAKN